MALIEWREEYSLDIPAVDDEHKAMIELINELGEELLDRRRKETILEFLREIKEVITAHFSTEEQLMREQHYPEYLAHKADHERLLVELGTIVHDLKEDRLVEPEVIGSRLDNWFGAHFHSYDARMHEVIHE